MKPQLITLRIENLALNAIIGLLESERKAPQRLLVNAKIVYKFRGKYMDYVAISAMIEQMLTHNAYHTLESALIDISNALKRHFKPIKRIKLSIKKLDILDTCIVGASVDMGF